MMPAAKHGDPQLGVDIHLCVVPPSPSPVPLPTPHISVVFDPFDYVPYIGASVTVCGMKRATAGTNGMVVHIPPGFPFAPKLPDKDDELFMGSKTVVADGDPFSFIGVPVLGCQVAGMLSIPRLKKKGSGKKAMLLPTTFNLAIPTNVFVGGPPTISLMGLAMKGLFSALGKFAKSGLFKRIRQKLFKKLKPGFLKCIILRAEPVNILTGEVALEQEDFTLPGRIPIEWCRSYTSGSNRAGLCGYGWETVADTRLEIDPLDGMVSLRHPSAGPLFFPQLPSAEGHEAFVLELVDGARLTDNGHEYRVRTKEDRIYRFPKALARVSELGCLEYPIGRIEDLCGNWLTFDRSGETLTGISESAGRRIDLRIENGRLRAVTLVIPGTDVEHTFIRYQYDADGDLVAVIDALSNPYRFGYDEHHLVRHTDRNGLSFHYAYDKTGENWRVTHSWGEGGLYDYTFEYDDVLKERRITDSLRNVSIVKLDERGLPIAEIDALGGRTAYEYDESGRTAAVIDPDSHRTEYEYDECGNLLKLTRPDGKTIANEFDSMSKAVTVIDPNGVVWRQLWDDRGLLLQQTSPLGSTSRFEYDQHGQLTSFVNPLEGRFDFRFDAYGNAIALSDPLQRTTQFIRDHFGNIESVTDPLHRVTRYRYDEKGRLTEAVLPSGAAIRCRYDPEDNLITYIDENGARTQIEHFGQGEVSKWVGPDGHTIEYQYDTEERLVAVINQRRQTYRFLRDRLGRIVEEIDYWGQSRKYAFSASGYIEEICDPMGRVVRYCTDALGRITKRSLPDPDGSDDTFDEIFEYDANGNFVLAANPHILIERRFDLEGRLVEEKQGEDFAIFNAYDPAGHRVSRRTQLLVEGRPYGHTVTFSYDLLGRVQSASIGDGHQITVARDAAGQIVSERLSSALLRQFEYDDDGRITHQMLRTDVASPLDVGYEYDASGALLARRESGWGADTFKYDPVGRITEHLDPHHRLKRYVYDAAGDRLPTFVREPAPSAVATLRDGARSSIAVRATRTDGGDAEWVREGRYQGTRYGFDRAGNLAYRQDERGELSLRWDANRRLVETVLGGVSTRYFYDPLGRRFRKATGSTHSAFFWDGDMMAVERTAGLSLLDAAVVCREYVAYPDGFVPLALIDATSSDSHVLFYCTDPNGLPIRLMNTEGEAMWAARPGALGDIRTLPGAAVRNQLRLQGQYEDDETGLYYNRYRYYEPHFGAFISQDPLGLSGGPNVYAFAPNVLTWIDPRGLKKCNINAATKKALKESKPDNIPNAHMHHIVMEGAFSHWKKENRELVEKARDILAKHDIDLQGGHNVVWAQNAGHSVEYAQKVLNALEGAVDSGGGRDAVVKTLDDIGKKLGAGAF